MDSKELIIPHHMAFIMDGNGRWAKERGLKRTEGHKVGIDKINTLVNCSLKYGVKEVSVYAFSTENWNRPKDEVNFLFKYMKSFFSKFKKSENKDRVQINVIGDKTRFSADLQKDIAEIEEFTKNNNELIFNIALNYGGKDDILYGIKNLLKKQDLDVNSLTFEDFVKECRSGNMTDIDLLVRTGREQRISNFFPLQLLYSELFFDETLWPDFSEKFFVRCIEEFNTRNRRYGGIKE